MSRGPLGRARASRPGDARENRNNRSTPLVTELLSGSPHCTDHHRPKATRLFPRLGDARRPQRDRRFPALRRRPHDGAAVGLPAKKVEQRQRSKILPCGLDAKEGAAILQATPRRLGAQRIGAVNCPSSVCLVPVQGAENAVAVLSLDYLAQKRVSYCGDSNLGIHCRESFSICGGGFRSCAG